MLQVLDVRSENYLECLIEVLSSQSYPALLIKNSFQDIQDSLNKLQILLQYYPPDHVVTLLANDCQVIQSISLLDYTTNLTTLVENVEFLYLPALDNSQQSVLSELQRLIQIVAQLRSPAGCPWDRAQTPQSLAPYVLEEAYETVAALRSAEPQAIAEELGDLLLQVVLQAQIFSESETFDLGTVARHIADKLIRRHLHVFGPQADPTIEMSQIHQTWDQIKQAEQPEQTLGQKLLQYSETLPPLMAALKISTKVVKAGFEWPTVEGIWDKIAEEEAELRQVLELSSDQESSDPAIDPEDLQRRRLAELGDVLFTVVNLGRWYGLDASAALASTNQRFANRWQKVEALVNQAGSRDLSDYSLEELEAFWQQAKKMYPY